MKKIILMVCILILICGCGLDNAIRESGHWGNAKSPIETWRVGKNEDIKLDYLFEIPETGVKIYRFIDMAHTRYVAVQSNKISVISTTPKQVSKNKKEYSDNLIETILN